MFSSPMLDTAIGLVFVFLLYSLLATSIQEAISTGFSLRAAMLRKGIVENMLSDTPNDHKWISILKGILGMIVKFARLLGFPSKKAVSNSLGDKFYDHPIVKNYGASRIFPLPSYIPDKNFSSVVVDLLKDNFDDHIENITSSKMEREKIKRKKRAQVKQQLETAADIIKIKELLRYYEWQYLANPGKLFINRETVEILKLLLRESVYDLDGFKLKLEGWFNDTMDRMSGWYKRQMQVILFLIGIVLAVSFNVDIIQISNKLATDKDARDKMVELAIKGADAYKDDPRVKRAPEGKSLTPDEQEINEGAFKEYQAKLDKVNKEIHEKTTETNNLLALGWNEYGKNDPDYLKYIQDYQWYWISPKIWERLCVKDIYVKTYYSEQLKIAIAKDLEKVSETDASLHKEKAMKGLSPERIAKLESRIAHNCDLKFRKDSIANLLFFKKLEKSYPIHTKLRYIRYAGTSPKKMLGFIILAFGVCLGAPFWFDLLNKLIKIRGTGKKETGSENTKATGTEQSPINVNINNSQAQGEEAVG